MGFEVPYASGLDLDGIPPDYHVAVFVRAHVTHARMSVVNWPIRATSVVEFLPPWLEVPLEQLFGWGDPEGMLDGDANYEEE